MLVFQVNVLISGIPICFEYYTWDDNHYYRVRGFWSQKKINMIIFNGVPEDGYEQVTMTDKNPRDTTYEWELLFRPGTCWFVWIIDNITVFSLAGYNSIASDEVEIREIESVFPPDVAFILHEVLYDAADFKPGECKKITVAIPGSEIYWPGYLSRLVDNRFLIVWSLQQKEVQEPQYCDINDYIRSERAVRKANEKLNYFNNIVRHDIANLVMGITGYLDIADELVSDEEVRLLMKKSRDLSERVRRVIDLTRSYQDLGIRPPSFIEATSVIMKIVNQREYSDCLVAEVQLSDLFVFVDRLFPEVIYEIIRNSVQYAGKGVRIRFTYTEGPEGLTFIIQDNGPGVHQDLKKSIFSRNYADRKGYGLYLASEILDITGVSIHETGEPGQGARFELLFPPDTYHFGNHFI